ncbi:MAG: restriction endonuclease subunit S [Hyphomonas oceanitis]|uniref:restriction endonuclease subunit S n=1 Tax=Hyphomonas oceanitis TaxID=81033 RepID=UPI0030022E9D
MSNDAKILELMEVADVSAGYPLRSSAEALDKGGVHFIQLKHVDTEAELDWACVPTVALPSKRDPQWLTDDDVIFAARGTRTFAYPLMNTPDHTVCAPQFFVLSAADKGRVLPGFLAWQINQRPAQEYLAQRSTGAHIPNVRRRALEEMPIIVPSLAQQEVIVELWRAAREERATLTRLMENRTQQMEALALGLFQNAQRARP